MACVCACMDGNCLLGLEDSFLSLNEARFALLGTSLAAKFLRANGITFFKVSEETLKLLGKSDMYYSNPESPPLTKPARKALDWAVNEKLKSGNALAFY